MMRVLSAVLSFTALFNGAFGALSPGSPGGPSGSSEAADIPSIEEVLGDYTPSREGVSWDDIEYFRYDPTDFYAGADELEALAASGDIGEITALYDELYDDILQVDSLYSIADLNYCRDVTDRYWSGELDYCYDLWVEMDDRLCRACRAVMEGGSGEGFADYVGPEEAELYAGYESDSVDGRLSFLWEQEGELLDRYYDMIAMEYEVTYTYNGREWTEDMLYSREGDDLYYRDYDGYLEIYYGLEEALCELVGPVYLELVANRAEQAELMGYDSYAEYCYEDYERDYTAEDAQALCDAVKAISPEYYDEDLYYSEMWYNTDNVRPAMDPEDMVAVMGSYVSEIDESLYDAWAYLATYGLYDMGGGNGRIDSSYTEYLAYYDTPFIFVTQYDYSCYDFAVLTHEFGHFVNSYENVPDDPLLNSWGSYDLMEIHSNGLELLFTEFYDDIYTSGADTARFQVLGDILYQVIDGCISDEFQRRVYADPDMTLEEVNRLYAEVCSEYGMDVYGDESCEWIYDSFFFERPLYDISYTVSGLAAIQIWDMAQTDFDAAVDTYLEILHKGAFDEGYFEVLSDCGLTLFTEDGAVEEICRPLIDEMTALVGPSRGRW